MSGIKPDSICGCQCMECLANIHSICDTGDCQYAQVKAAQQKPTRQQGPELSGCASAVSAPRSTPIQPEYVQETVTVCKNCRAYPCLCEKSRQIDEAEFTKAFRDKPPVAPELKDIVESTKLNDRDKDQIRSAWHLICDSGKYMMDLIRTDIEKTYSGDFDRMHRMRHSLRDLFAIVCVLNKRGNSIYTAAAQDPVTDYDYTATINAIAAACRVNEAGHKEISAAMFWKVYREQSKS